MNTQGIHQ